MAETLAESFVRYIHEDLLKIKQPHFDIAWRLCEAKSLSYAEELGFANIYELAEVEFGFKRSSTAAYISVATTFMNSHMCVVEAFSAFSFSQLVEMLPLDDYDRRQIKSDMTVKQIRQWRQDHKFVEFGDRGWIMYGSLSAADKARYDELKKEKKKRPVEENSVQTSGQTVQPDDVQSNASFDKDIVVTSDVHIPFVGRRLELKNKSEREAFLAEYKSWGMWLSVPELELTCYKYKFANGDELVVSESSCYDDYNLGSSRHARLIRYHLKDRAERNFFDLSGVSKTFVLEYMTNKAKEI